MLDGSPAGVTVHYIDAGVDTGDIIGQREVPIEPIDTGGRLHAKLTRELIDLFKETWPSIKTGTNPRIAQDQTRASYHRRKDMDALDHIDLDREYRARDLINLLRGRTYPPYPAAYFVEDGRKVYIRTQLFYEDALDPNAVPDWDQMMGEL
jgi:methionyl-tRNA formyltransferase